MQSFSAHHLEMRDFADEYRLSARVPWEIDEIIAGLEGRMNRDRGLWQSHKEGRRKKPTRAAIVAAIILNFSKLSADQQQAALKQGMLIYNHLAEGNPLETADSLEQLDGGAGEVSFESGPTGRAHKGKSA